jgi:hypothetical protein
MRSHHASFFSATCIVALLAGCGGGSSSVPASSSNTQKVILSVAGSTSTLNAARRPQSLDGTPITILVGGVAVGTGTLDATGKATVTLSSAVPLGTTVEITIGSHTFTATLAISASATDVSVTLNLDGSATVSMHSDTDASQDAATETEDQDGKPIVLNSSSQQTLPSTLPIVITATCTSLTVAPAAGVQISRLILEQKANDSDHASNFRFDGALTGPLTVAMNGSSARLHVLVFGASGQPIFEMTAPLGAFTSTTGASPTASCSQTPPASHEVPPIALPTAFPSWHPEPHSSADASPIASSSASASATPTAAASAVPSAHSSPH